MSNVTTASPRVILDTAFEDGSRFMAAWRGQAPQAMLFYLALTPQLAPAESIGDAQLRALWPLNLPGFHRIVLDDGRVTLDLLVGAAEDVLPEIEARVDQIYLRAGLAPMLTRQLARLAQPEAELLAEAPDEAMKLALRKQGFVEQPVPAEKVSSQSGMAGAVYRALYQSRKPRRPAPPLPAVRQAIVIGAGIAGASASHRLCAAGWQVTLIERHGAPGQEASGNVAGIFMPLLSKDDNIPTRLTRAAFLFGLREWQRLGGVGQVFEGASCGVLQLARDAGHAQVQQDVVATWNYPQQYVRWLDAPAASALLGGPTPHGGWLFGQGGWARPASLCAALLAACGSRLQQRFHHEALRLERHGENWQVFDASGAMLAEAPVVILANGAGAVDIAQAAQLPLARLRGQVTHLPQELGPRLALAVCREAYVTPPNQGVICAGATYSSDDDRALRASCQQENLARLAEIIPGEAVAALAATAPLAGRVGFRCAAPDRLPLVGPLPDYSSGGRLERLRDMPVHAGLYSLLGYASRGIIWSTLMAELLVSQLEQRPMPLEATLVDALVPGRFLLKQRRRAVPAEDE
ncbi:FAD-dependent 5-carboxymethylaminomethyl-2-thiouridine(34) oxidoreductase MnmC [Pseudoduganella sp. FT93W]|uniref:FAD-dependent 5-carboxymethylaminomethyl-2-thiouridine(34) oxidoreductase MnmC n=1 Tax=Duganella fentianensis TaxID=2692177 RepID=A0A845I417_9BURK|nr:FAD-dependent 5-carboxymethylaminomethyl-2-thiouridine(34) oxidoreductase MnmC [Duganella fentianensis]MYN46651.1 FAD-dependent 5-carboxymethylaminomethyl-2-thiouridine(34) oxidoreductase MnmC [Duganella fentianensis]